MISESISEEIPVCKPGECFFLETLMDGACPTSAKLPCFAFAEACRLRKKYWSLSNEEIGDHVRMVVARGCSKKPPAPDSPEAYLRQISVNLESDLVRNDVKLQKIAELTREDGAYTEFVKDVNSRNPDIDPIAARDEVAFFASNLPSEIREGFCTSTRAIFYLMVGCGYAPRDLKEAFPDITVTEVKYHQAKIREVTAWLGPVLKESQSLRD